MYIGDLNTYIDVTFWYKIDSLFYIVFEFHMEDEK